VLDGLQNGERVTLIGWTSGPDRFTALNARDPRRAAPATTGSSATGSAESGDWQRVHGTVLSRSGSTLTFRADDGRTLSVDMSNVNPSVQQALTQGEGATLVGFPGASASQFRAEYIQQDSSDPSRGGRIVGQAPPAPTPAPSTADDARWVRVHGTVVSVSGNTFRFRRDDGRTVNVDMAAVSDAVRRNVKAGDKVTVVAHPGTGDRLVAQYIQQDSSDPSRGGSVGAASPAMTRPSTRDDCRDDRWRTYTNPTFKNQGECIAWVNKR
jgi:uncharacterized protein YdeI (BOF family)